MWREYTPDPRTLFLFCANSTLNSKGELVMGAGSAKQAKAMSAMVKAAMVDNVFITKQSAHGTDKSLEQLDSGQVHTWHHFRVDLPKGLVYSGSKTEAFKCHVRWLKAQGYTQIGSREFRPPDGGPVLVLPKKSKFGGLLRQGKSVDGKSKRYMPGDPHTRGVVF